MSDNKTNISNSSKSDQASKVNLGVLVGLFVSALGLLLGRLMLKPLSDKGRVDEGSQENMVSPLPPFEEEEEEIGEADFLLPPSTLVSAFQETLEPSVEGLGITDSGHYSDPHTPKWMQAAPLLLPPATEPAYPNELATSNPAWETPFAAPVSHLGPPHVEILQLPPADDILPAAWEFDMPSAPLTEQAEEEILEWSALMREIVETVLLTLLIFIVMRALIQNYRIEGYSMEPNLHEEQYLIVNKVSYYLGEPQRGDIIVFEYTKGDPNGPERDYIKRIIGLPGDTVECRPNQILVNGQVIDEPYGPNPWSYTCPARTLGPDEYFVLGDNRPQSSDSHQWGALERKDIIGKAWLSYWPRENWGWIPNYPIEAPDPAGSVATSPLEQGGLPDE